MMMASPASARTAEVSSRPFSPRLVPHLDSTRHRERERVRTGLDVGPVLEAEGVADDALGRHHVVPPALDRLALAPRPPHGPDAVRVAEPKDAVAGDHGRARVRARRRLHDLAHGAKDVVAVDAELARLLERVGEEVEEELRVGRRVDVAVRVVVEVVAQVVGVGQVAVLRARTGSEGRQDTVPRPRCRPERPRDTQGAVRPPSS